MGRGADLSKVQLFRELGYGGDPPPYERALEAAGLSRPGKQRISAEKAEPVRELFAARFVRVCQRADCRRLAAARAPGRMVVPAQSQSDCELCAGSINALAVDEMVGACGRLGWRRLCIVGGSPNTAAELLALTSGRLESG